MHADELEIDEPLVRALVSDQFPEWAELPLERVRSPGTDNALYRLGDELVVRLPRIASAAGPIRKEHRWLPMLGPHLPLEVPVPEALGRPSARYPWAWSVLRWLEGAEATGAPISDPADAARLGRFVAALQRLDPDGGPSPGTNSTSRGEPLANRDLETRAAIERVADRFDADQLVASWEAALVMPAWERAGVWLHGDLIATNLLVRDGRLAAVIDWGCLAVGDPACDAMAAWTLLVVGARDAFRTELAIDDATWDRGRGWALSWAVIALPYYGSSNPVLAGLARRTIDEVLADQAA